MDIDAGKLMAVERCGVFSDCLCFLRLYIRENIAEEVLEVWERKEDKEYSFGEGEAENGLGKYNMHVRKQ